MPGAGNPQAWNRYAYTLYNPLRYIDPSGHQVGNSSDDPILDGGEVITLQQILEGIYGFIFEGTWLDDQLEIIYDAVLAIQNVADSLGISGMKWVRTYLGTAFTHGSLLNTGDYNYVKNGTMYLTGDFTMNTVIHEFGHVLDNNIGYARQAARMGFDKNVGIQNMLHYDATIYGGGLADDFFTAMSWNGSKPSGFRFCNGTCMVGNKWAPKNTGTMIAISPDNAYATGEYANWSSADYFAESFKFLITNDKDRKLDGPVNWMLNNVFIEDIP